LPSGVLVGGSRAQGHSDFRGHFISAGPQSSLAGAVAVVSETGPPRRSRHDGREND